jgi:elongator complex protein 4
MSFRKRNVGLTSTALPPASPGVGLSLPPASVQQASQIPGVRLSPLDGRSTTSTGTQSLDDLLAGHAGLVLGNSLLIEESGTTDYAGILLRYYAAEGVLQGHQVHVVGVGEQWRKDLPGPSDVGISNSKEDAIKLMDKEKMKIAWRYERLGEFGGVASNSRGGLRFIRLRRIRLVLQK